MTVHEIERFDAYKTSKMLLRVSLLTSFILLLTTLGLISLLMGLFPLKEIRPMLLTVKDKANQVVRIEPLEVSHKGHGLLLEKLARNFVLLRETIDLQTEKERYEELSFFSEEDLMQDFIEWMDPENPESPYKKRETSKVIRNVQIISSTSLAPSAPNIFQVEWISQDLKQGEVLGEERWVSTMTVELNENETTYENQYVNPVGFTVTHYSVAKKEALK